MNLLLISIVIISSGSGEERVFLTAISAAAEENRASATFGTIHFQYTTGAASNDDDARQGNISGSIISNGLYVFDGHRYHYELVREPEVTASHMQQTGKDTFNGPLGSKRFIANEKLCLVDQLNVRVSNGRAVHSHQAYIGAASDSVFGGSPLPDNLGVGGYRGYHVGRDIEKYLRDRDLLKLRAFKNGEKFEGEPIVYLAFESPTMRREYWLSVEHGALPRKLSTVYGPDRNSGNKIVRYYDDIRWVDRKRWLPFTVTFVHQAKQVQRIRVLDADCRHRPSPSEFRLEFPEAIALTNMVQMVRYDARKLWDLESLPPPTSKESRRIKLVESGPPGPVMQGPRSPMPAWLGALTIVGGAMIGGVIMTTLRRRRDV